MADVRVSGYAVRFMENSLDLGGFVERFAPGAFRVSLAADDVIFMLRSHDTGRPVASTEAGTLELSEDQTGLRFVARLGSTGDGGDLGEMVRRRVLSRMSFGFQVSSASDEAFERINGRLTRTIRRARLIEISPVTHPAYPTSSIQARSLADDLDERQGKLDAVKQAERQRDLRRRRVWTAEAELQARQTPPPEPLSTIKARASQKRVALARRFGINV